MKTIKFPEDKATAFKAMLLAVVSQNEDTGYTTAEVRVMIKVIDVVEEAEAEVVLEDAHYAAVHHRIRNMKWRVAAKDIDKFVSCIENAEG